jgi:hypothetical protein
VPGAVCASATSALAACVGWAVRGSFAVGVERLGRVGCAFRQIRHSGVLGLRNVLAVECVMEMILRFGERSQRD